ncbi:ABC transporter substrate-binding protein [Halosimplex aquaticum]|uniref:ABC transporter substrate-binding protein n=1 Tax=Halosimplex aquaticum TaxID=3026162 RepID=A0ABD5XWD9_9EURY|nr:ABC transporter substrate-binding protein [Halosimplex aquaticum]
MSRDDNTVSRRQLLKHSGAAGAVGLVGLAGCTEESGDGGGGGGGGGDGGDGGGDGGGGGGGTDYPSLGNYPIEGDTAMFGFNVPKSGPYSSEGEDELRAYKLAVKHLNNGGGWVDNWDDLSGDGVLGYEVDFVEGDTATDASTAEQSASRMIQRDDVIMFAGGSSSAVAIAQQGVAQREKVMFTCCLTHSNDTTGKDCARYSFREMFNAYMTGQALVPVVTEEYGDDLSFYQLYADYSWGKTVEESMRKFFGEAGWSEVDSVATPLDTSDFSSYLSEAQSSGADALFLNHYGLDGANSLSQAVEAGIDEDMQIIMPLYNRPMAESASSAIEGIYGTIAWDSQMDNGPSNTFTKVFGEEYDGRVPSGPAQLAYAGTLQYAAAVERAGTFYPPEVIRELEGYEYDNIGMGQEKMRKCDHQAQRAIPVVKGLPESEQEDGNYFEIVDLTSREDVGYACDEGPAAKCELGEYGDE